MPNSFSNDISGDRAGDHDGAFFFGRGDGFLPIRLARPVRRAGAGRNQQRGDETGAGQDAGDRRQINKYLHGFFLLYLMAALIISGVPRGGFFSAFIDFFEFVRARGKCPV
jgi:hypothetical protein